ncbi:MAG: hypothetical protein OHK0013_06220 [Sandaracinaceae bacterium]
MASPADRRRLEAGDQQSALRTRLFVAAGWLVGVVFVGAGGFHVIGNRDWSWGDCFYFTVITLSTVGFGHPRFEHAPRPGHPRHEHPEALRSGRHETFRHGLTGRGM